MITKKEMVCYDTDASRLIGSAERVVFPRTVQMLQRTVQTSQNIVPRGAGSERVGGTIPNNAVVVDMSKMNQVSNFNAIKRTVKVEAGITLRELNERLNKIGFEFPIQINNQGISSIGGMIAMNQIGNRSMKYGKMKDWVEEIELVDGRGELVKFGKSDIMDACSMEGITGIIVSAVLKIIPKIKRSASVFQSENINDIFSVLRRLKSEKEVCSLNLFPPQVSKLIGLPEKYNVIVEFDSERGKIKDEAYGVISSINDRVYFRLASEGYYESEDPWFFFDKLKDFALFLEANAIPYFSKVGAGTIYPFFRDDEKEKRKDVIKMINRMGGKAGEYGFGLTRKYMREAVEKKVIERVKVRHDPFGKMNKGKVLDREDFGPDLSLTPKPLASEVRHLRLINQEEIEELKPFIEQREDSGIIEEVKTPEEKMEEFIEKVELIEKTESPEEKLEEQPDYGLKQAEEYEIKTTLDDYESTYKSELKEENKRKVEEFARNIAYDIIHPKKPATEVEKRAIEMQEASEKQEAEKFSIDPNIERRGKLTKEEEEEINRIMYGGGKKND